MKRASLACVVVALGGCAAPSSGSPTATASSAATTATSPAPAASPVAELPDGQVIAAERVMFSEDMEALRLSFVGAREWSADDPGCTADYAGWANVTGEILAVAVVETVEMRPGGLTPDGQVIECDAAGHGREVIVELPGPFRGSSVQNLDGQAYPVAPGDAELYEIPASALPEGWALRLTVGLLDFVPPFPSFRTYSPVDLPGADDPQLQMIQYFEAVAGQGPQGAGDVTRLDIDGSPAFLVEEPDGDVIISWNSPSGNPITLMARERAISAAELIAVADAARLPGR